MMSLFMKLKRLKPILKSFNLEMFGEIFQKVAELRKKLSALQLEVLSSLSVFVMALEKKLFTDLKTLLL